MNSPHLVAFAASSRAGSWNQQLLTAAVDAARAAGATVDVVDLRALALPIFDQDLQIAEGIPASARDFKQRLTASAGFLIASPEYNSSLSPLLKNALDWASRSETEDEPPLVAYRGKIAALFSASPSALGGLRGLVHLRSILGTIGVLVLPDQVCLTKAHEAFDATSGKLSDQRRQAQVTALANSLVTTARKLALG